MRTKKTKSFPADNINTLGLSLVANISIKETLDPSNIKIEYTGTERQLDNLVINSEGNSIVIKSKSSNNVISCNNFSSNTTYINNICVSNNVIYNNDEEIMDVTVYLPKKTDLDVDISGTSVLNSSVKHADVNLNVSGCSRYTLTQAEDVEISLSGQSSGQVYKMDGHLALRLSGQSSSTINGDFKSVRADLSGMSNVRTVGPCQGNYKVNASGMCQVNHSGKVSGKVSKMTSGMCSINI